MSKVDLSRRVQFQLSDVMHGKVSAYAETMGMSVPEACKHILTRGLEQIQAVMTARDSVVAIEQLVGAFSRQIEIEETLLGNRQSDGRGLVTPAQSLKNETKVKSIKP